MPNKDQMIDRNTYGILYNKCFLLVLFLITFKIWNKLTSGKYRSGTRMDGKTVIITGANAGIGKETARDLARRGARVILACRDLKRGKEAQEDIITSTGNKDVILHKLDLCSLNSVREFVRTVKDTESRLDVLINNAGSGGLPNKITKDGLQLQMQTNHFGPFLLTILLLDLLKKSAPSRIITVASVNHNFATLTVNNLNSAKPLYGLMAYNDSKLANILMSNELAKKLEGTGVTSNSLHPGVIATDIWKSNVFAMVMMQYLMRIFLKNVIEGIQTTVYLAVSKDAEGVTGKYFVDCKEAATSKAAQDEGLARKIWEKSEELVRLQPSERFYL